jgi:hypothetical protein
VLNNNSLILELVIDGDADLATATLEEYSVQVTRSEPTRFITEVSTVIGIAATVVQLTNGLVELVRKLRNNSKAPRVTARSVSGKQLTLNTADESQIASFVNEVNEPAE